jgi:hypothetical protein
MLQGTKWCCASVVAARRGALMVSGLARSWYSHDSRLQRPPEPLRRLHHRNFPCPCRRHQRRPWLCKPTRRCTTPRPAAAAVDRIVFRRAAKAAHSTLWHRRCGRKRHRRSGRKRHAALSRRRAAKQTSSCSIARRRRLPASASTHSSVGAQQRASAVRAPHCVCVVSIAAHCDGAPI